MEVVTQARNIAKLIQEHRLKLWQKERQRRFRDTNQVKPRKVCVDLHGRMVDPSGQDV